jgi:hypothetical protein
MDFFCFFHAAMSPMESMVLPEPPCKAAIMIRGKSIISGCFEIVFKNQGKNKPGLWQIETRLVFVFSVCLFAGAFKSV